MPTKEKVLEIHKDFIKKGYVEVFEVIHPSLLEFLKISLSIPQKESVVDESDIRIIGAKEKAPTTGHYGHIIGESLLAYLTPIYSKIAQKNLIPTYSYFRNYFKSNSLYPHIDRSACQYSATLLIDSDSMDNPWPIRLYDLERNYVVAKSTPGSIVFYKGEEVLHWREPLESNYSSHLFLHWVDKDDPNYESDHFDGRNSLGDNWVLKD